MKIDQWLYKIGLALVVLPILLLASISIIGLAFAAPFYVLMTPYEELKKRTKKDRNKEEDPCES